MEDGEKLAAYETDNYLAELCLIRYTNGQKPGQAAGLIQSLRRIWMRGQLRFARLVEENRKTGGCGDVGCKEGCW